MKSAIFYAIPIFLLLIAIELLVGYFQQKKLYSLKDTITNLSIGVGNQAIGVCTAFLLVGFYIGIYQNYSFFPEVLQPSIWTVFLCLVVHDFLYYWAHRWSHEWNFLWAAHVVHHQSEEYNLSVALRQSWFHNLLAFFIFLPIPLLGFEPTMFFGVAAFLSLYQFWIHTKAIKKLPRWFEFIFNSPSHHRVHHGVDPKYIDKNHGAVFILWDRLFGTFKKEEEEPTYGITTPLKSWNPTWANLHYWADMFKLAYQTPKWSDKFKVFFARPGWRPEELGGQQAIPDVDKENYEKFDTHVDNPMQLYAILQFFVALIGLVVFMNNFARIGVLSTSYHWIFLTCIILTIMIVGAILGNKRWAIVAEYVRLGLILFSLNTFYYFWFIDWFTIMISVSMGLAVLSIVYFTVSWRSWESLQKA